MRAALASDGMLYITVADFPRKCVLEEEEEAWVIEDEECFFDDEDDSVLLPRLI